MSVCLCLNMSVRTYVRLILRQAGNPSCKAEFIDWSLSTCLTIRWLTNSDSSLISPPSPLWRDFIRKSWLLGRLVWAFMVWAHSAYPSLKQQLTKHGNKTLNLFPSFSAVTNIESWRVKSALSNEVSLISSSSSSSTSLGTRKKKKPFGAGILSFW